MSEKYIVPVYNLSHFTCPHCGVLAEQKKSLSYLNLSYYVYSFSSSRQKEGPSKSLASTTCQSCNEVHIWLQNRMIYPISTNTPLANEDMPEEVKSIYEEARLVYPSSFKASAALLRLGLQQLCVHLGEDGKDINDNIKNLVGKGLDPNIQMALDIIRVTGNHAVHPGQIDLLDNDKTASSLFELLNFIVEQMITRPKKIEAMFGKLPEGVRAAIEKRDSK